MEVIDDIDLAEHIYEVMRREAGTKEVMGQAIHDMLSFKTDDRLFKKVVVIMAMIHANTEGH
jgi:hypothetical protein